MKNYHENYHEVTDLTARKRYAYDVEPDDVDGVEVPNAIDARGRFRAVELERRTQRKELAIYSGCPFDEEASEWR